MAVVVVAQLVEQLLPLLEVRGLNPVGNTIRFFSTYFTLVNDKNKVKRGWEKNL